MVTSILKVLGSSKLKELVSDRWLRDEGEEPPSVVPLVLKRTNEAASLRSVRLKAPRCSGSSSLQRVIHELRT